MLGPSLLLLVMVHLSPSEAAHECERPCVVGDNRTCIYDFSLQEYHTLSRACYDCPDVLVDCLREECVVADGVKVPFLAVNRQLPGPSLQVCEGDRVVVNVYNLQLSDTEIIHWHGQHMEGDQYYDGVPYLTQCPVLGSTFRYNFLASTPGTQLWHSHLGLHRNSVFGSLVVRQAEDPHRGLYDTDLPEHVLAFSDWKHISIATAYSSYHHAKGDFLASSILINGRGRNSAADLEGVEQVAVPLTVVQVTSGLRHRLRFINGGGYNCPMIVAVESHRMTIIAVDGDPIVPFTTDSLVMLSGERFDVVLEANQPVDNYWITINGLLDCMPFECVQGAVLRYDGAPIQDPISSLTYDPNYPPGVVVNPLNSDGVAAEEVTMAELDSLTPSILQETVDKQFFLGFDLKQVNNTLLYNPDLYPYNGVSEEWRINTPQINGITFAFPPSPPLSQPLDEQPTICYYGEEPPCEGDFCKCTYVIEVALGETVEFVLVDEGTLFDSNHPFHLHGYNFHVVAMGKLGKNTTVQEVVDLDAAGGITRRLVDTVKKDTVTIPDGGYTVVRFTADNPGWWLMHCHLLFHSELGMVGALHVGGVQDVPPVPQGFPTCGPFVPDF